MEFPVSLISLLVPLAEVELVSVHIEDSRVVLVVSSTQSAVVCPQCRSVPSRVHSRYTRTAADLPCGGRVLSVSVQVRRFFCDARHCERKTFAERFGTVLPAYARRTARLTAALCAVAFAAGGEGGARLAHVLQMNTSPRTLLRLLHAQSVPTGPAPRVVGLDEWAWKKGRNYGTLCVDLERRQPIDLLPDRAPATVAAWLTAHPTIDIITRDRNAGFTDAATRGAPQAIQVADRFHLLGNLRAALERFFQHKRPLLVQAAHVVTEEVRGATTARPTPHGRGTGRTRASELASRERWAGMVARYHTIHDLRAKHVDLATIAHQVGVSRRTVHRYLHMPAPPLRKQPVARHASHIEAYKPYIVQRWNDGCRNARQLFRELTAKGYRYGSRLSNAMSTNCGWRQGFPTCFVAQHQRTITTLISRNVGRSQLAKSRRCFSCARSNELRGRAAI